MILYTIGFTQKPAQQFFEIIRANDIKMLIDVRLNNSSQLAGFSKGNDLEYFLSEICKCGYEHCDNFAPTKEIFDGFKGKKIKWAEFELEYNSLIKSRGSIDGFFDKYSKYRQVCLLCSEATAELCHRRLLAEMIAEKYPKISVKHI